MIKAYKYRIYPDEVQQELIAKTFGCARFVYNTYLAKRIELWEKNKESMSFNQCSKDLTKLKEEFPWLKEVDSRALQCSLKDLDVAYQKFFKEHSGYPKFKSKKDNRHSYRTKGWVSFADGYIKLPKLGKVRARGKRVPEGRILNVTVSQEPSGKYFASICCTDVEIKPFEKTENVVGIELGLEQYCTMSDGTMIPNPKYLEKLQDKLARLQRNLSRKTKGGSNYNKARIKVARLHEHIGNQRKNFLQNLSTEIVKKYDVICIKDLKVSTLNQDTEITKSIRDAAWYEFTRQLEYKSNWYGKKLVKVECSGENDFGGGVEEAKEILQQGLNLLEKCR